MDDGVQWTEFVQGWQVCSKTGRWEGGTVVRGCALELPAEDWLRGNYELQFFWGNIGLFLVTSRYLATTNAYDTQPNLYNNPTNTLRATRLPKRTATPTRTRSNPNKNPRP